MTEGFEANPGAWPWAVILGRPSQDGFSVICGGILINTDTVLSVASCVDAVNKTVTHVRLGEHDITTTSDGASHVDISISSAIHPVALNTVPISMDQLKQFRGLKNDAGAVIADNFRPVQPLNGRKVYVR